MKTLVVLFALAAVAIAAPTQPDSGFGTNHLTTAQNKLLATIRREKKSPTELFSNDADLINQDATSPLAGSELDSESETSARTFHKKPIIVKKTHGYHHLYRDSDEEQADSQEKCIKEVKVKLCDAGKLMKTKSDKMRSSTIEDANEMEQTINMAKEAVENVQRCLQQDDGDGCKPKGPKMAQRKQNEPGSEAEMHADIEDARQTLEHIQQNFGNLESMNLRAAALNDAEALEDAQIKISSSNEEKMAQWKQAIENIQRNVEIVKNIEDSFKSSPSSDILDSSKKAKPVPALHETSMKSTDKSENMQSDMSTAASEPIESKIELHELKEEALSDDNQSKSDKAATTNSGEISFNVQSNGVAKKPLQTEEANQEKSAELNPSLHTAESLKHAKICESSDGHLLKESENTEKLAETDVAQSMRTMQTNANTENGKHDAEEWENEKNSKHEKSAWVDVKEKNVLAKSTENIAPKMDDGNSAAIDTTTFMKSVEHVEQKDQKEFIDTTTNVNHGKNSHDDMTMKSVDQMPHASEQHAVEIPMKPNNQEAAMSMKASEHDNIHNQAQELSNIQSQETRVHSDKIASIKAAEELNSEFQNKGLERNTHVNEMHATAPSPSHFEVTTGHPFPRIHESMKMAQGKSAVLDSAVQPTMRMNMKEAMGKSALEHNNMLQWNQHHAARGAYGAGAYGSAAGGSGAVGVFPNANVGGCAIPLLLSCSPSVVSGSLAKSHPSAYAPAAYRTGEDFKFHNKRDIINNNKISATKVKRTPTKVIQKIPVDKKF